LLKLTKTLDDDPLSWWLSVEDVVKNLLTQYC